MNILLVSYSGPIKTPASLAPDNGLANLAGAIIASGRKAYIHDLNTVSVFEASYCPRLDQLARKYVQARASGQPHDHPSMRDLLNRIRRLDDERLARLSEHLYGSLKELVRSLQVEVIGFKCWGSEGGHAIRSWCKKLRVDFPRLKILLGGFMCEAMPIHAGRFYENFDAMATGKAEKTIIALLEYLEGKCTIETIPGVLWKESGEFRQTQKTDTEFLDDLPWPTYDREVYPALWNGDKLNFIMLDESRGCPNHCHFCLHPGYSGQCRHKSVSRTLAEIHYLQEKLQTRYLRFAGSNPAPAFIRQFSEAIIERGIDLRFSCFLHTTNVRADDIPLFRRAGLRACFAGIESADQELLMRAAAKWVPESKAEEATRILCSNRVFSTGSFIVPLPFETPESHAHTRAFIERVFAKNDYASAAAIPATPLPGTQWWDRASEFGFEFEPDEYLERCLTLSVRTLFPQEFQDTLPYKLHGRTHAEMNQDLAIFMTDMNAKGVTCNLTDDVALIAHGCKMKPRVFRDWIMPAIMSGDAKPVKDMVRLFNANKPNLGRDAYDPMPKENQPTASC